MKELDKKNIEDIFAMTPLQEGMLFSYLKDTKKDYYFEQLSLEISGEINKKIFEEAWNFVIKTNEVLRAVFRWEEVEKPIQVILKEHILQPDYYDFSKIAVNVVKKSREKVKEKDKKRGFNLRGVPFRVILCKLQEDEYEMVISNHHILYDGWSTGIILREFLRAYNVLASGQKLDVSVKTKFKEFVKWIQSKDTNEQERFWKRYLKGFDTNSFLSVKRQTGRKNEIKRYKFELSRTLSNEVNDFVKKQKFTTASLLYSAWGILLQIYNNGNSVMFGTTAAGRTTEISDVGNIVGLFINTIPLVMNSHGNSTLLELVHEVGESLIEREQYESTSLMDIRRYHRVETSTNLFDSIVVIENYPLDRFLTDNAGILRIHRYSMRYLTEYDLSVVISTFQHLKVTLTYDAGSFSDKAIESIGRHFQIIIEEIINNSQKTVKRINLLSETEKRQLLIDFNDTKTSYPVIMAVHRLFEEQVEKFPHRTAVIFDHEHLTYKRMNEKANQLARHLRSKGVITSDAVIGIMIDNSVALIVSILGVLKAGGAYLPLSTHSPETRRNFVIKDSGAKLLLVSKTILNKSKENVPWCAGPGIITVDDTNIYPENDSNLDGHTHPGNLVYIIYTSGTTGKPKGVAVHHRGLCNYLWWAKTKYVKNENVNFPLYTSISFDMTVTSLYTPLISGNGVVVYKDDEKELLVEKIIDEARIQVIKLTPAHLKILRDRKKGKSNSKFSTGIKRFIVGGEELETQLAMDIHEIFSGEIEIYNEYGPTETVVGCMIHRFNPEEKNRLTVPIGIPVDNMQIYIWDDNGKPVPKEVVGEIAISGAGVARGYLNNPELTFERFTNYKQIPGYKSLNLSKERDSPFPPTYPAYHSPVYRSGDQAKWLPDASIEFLGRADRQVKIRGYRIELGEIESKLMKYKKNPGRESRSNGNWQNLDFQEPEQGGVCKKCLLPENYPGIRFNREGVCSVCQEFAGYQKHAENYFKTGKDFCRLIEQLKQETKNNGKVKYDCLLLYSGGKDSSYVLYKLVDMGLSVLTFTFDNGYISDAAFRNIEHTTSQLNLDHIVGKCDNMKSIFLESLETHHEVCTGCWRALNTIGGRVAYEKGIPIVVTGLSRGQIFDMKLHGLFSVGIFAEEMIEEQLLMLRKMYHSREEKLSRLMDVDLTPEVIEQVEFVDFFRYDNVTVNGILAYLDAKNWSVPTDTGFCSTNCIVNDVGIYVHLKEKGYHNYAAPLSWDLRYGLLNREKAMKEINFTGDIPKINQILEEIGYFSEIPGSSVIKDAVVIDKKDGNGNKYLSAYIVSEGEVKVPQLREYLARELPEYMLPSYFTRVDKIPLTANGKVDRQALPDNEGVRPELEVAYVMPATELEETVVSICCQVLNMKKIGIYDNFFDLGANSYHIIQINSRLNKVLGIDIPIVKLFTHPTVSKFADYLSSGKGKKERIPGQRDRSDAIAKGRGKLKARKEAIKLDIDRVANG